MYAKFPCPHCSKTLKVSEEHFGQTARCPHCKTQITIPVPEAPPETPANEGLDWQSIVSDSSTSVSAVPVGSSKPATKKSAKTQKTPTRSSGSAMDSANVSLLWTSLLGLAVTIVFLGLLFPFKNTYLGQLFWQRGWVPMAETFLFMWGGAILGFKYWRLRRQRDTMLIDVLPTEISEEITPANVDQFIDHVHQLPVSPEQSYLVDRVLKCLEHFRIRRNNQEVGELISSQSDIVVNTVISSYSIVKVAIWAIPILGFIGTVLGLSAAMGGLSGGLGDSADISQLKDKLGTITAGLGVSFDTTLIALFMSLILSFPTSTLQKQEEDLLAEVDQYCGENLILRLRDGQASVNPENATSLEAATKAAIEAQQAVYRMAEEQMKRMTQQHEMLMRSMAQAIGSIHASLTKSLEDNCSQFGDRVQSLSAGLRSLNGIISELGGKPIIASTPEKKSRWSFWSRANGDTKHG